MFSEVFWGCSCIKAGAFKTCFFVLGFGAQSIEYFTYAALWKEHGSFHFSYASVDFNQSRTKTCDYIKEVNTKLRSVVSYFKNAKVNQNGPLGGLLEDM